MATFIKQIARTKEDLPAELEKLFDHHNRNAGKSSYTELCQLFLAISKHFDRVFVVLDALDESDSSRRPELILFLCDIAKSTEGNVKLFITSRKEPDIERSFSDVPTIQIEATKVAEDIELYVEAELERRLKEGTLKMRDLSLKDDILQALLGRAGGM